MSTVGTKEIDFHKFVRKEPLHTEYLSIIIGTTLQFKGCAANLNFLFCA